MSTSFLSKFKIRIKVRQKSAVKNDDKHVDYCINVTDEVEVGKIIIDNMNLATKKITCPSYSPSTNTDNKPSTIRHPSPRLNTGKDTRQAETNLNNLMRIQNSIIKSN